MEVELKQILFGTPEYKSEVSLRSQILREPLGLRFSSEELDQESGDIHIGAFQGNNILGCLVLTPQNNRVVKMRQVAVAENAQRLGIGKKLVQYSELVSQNGGFVEIVLNARQTAIPFYLALNYKPIGDIFEEVKIPHQKMTKSLVAQPVNRVS